MTTGAAGSPLSVLSMESASQRRKAGVAKALEGRMVKSGATLVDISRALRKEWVQKIPNIAKLWPGRKR